jgi:TolA-binding protein
MRTYDRILDIKRLYSYESQVRLKQANVYRLMDRLDEAFAVYEEVIKRFPRSDESAEAYYRMGRIEQKLRRDREKAKEFYGLARKEKSTSEGGRAAMQVLDHLNDLDKYRRQIEKKDDGSLEALFSLAETFLFSLGEPDSALAAYRLALDVADTTDYAPKAMFAIGLIYADSLDNEAAARETFQSLIDRYPVSPYAVEARNRINQHRADDALAEARFREAEALRLEGAAPEDYISILKRLPEEYPNSLYAPKAMYALAWTYETGTRDLEAARQTYEQLRARYPLTRFAEAAAEKIDSGALTPPEPPPEPEPSAPPAPSEGAAEVPPDTTSAAESAPEAPPDSAAVSPETSAERDTAAAVAADTSGARGARLPAARPRRPE